MSFTRPPSLTKSICLLSALALGFAVAACSSSTPARPATGTAGSGTTGTAGSTSGTAGSTGAAGSTSGTAGSSGTTGTAGSNTGTAGSGAAGTTGAAGSGGVEGTAGTPGAAGSGAAGSAPDGGSSPDGGTTAYHRFVCPAGPFAAQMQGTVTNICNGTGFKYNYAYNEGPTWIATQNAFFFSNFIQGNSGANKSAGDIIKVTLGADPTTATCEVWLHDVGCNGLGVSSTGKLLGACHGPRAIMEYDPATKAPRTVATMADNKMFDSPNDLISHSNGTIYFSNATFELGGRPQGLGQALVRIDPDGSTTVVQMGGLNGMALSPDETKLYVVGMGVWNIGPDGKQTTKTNEGAPGGDGIAMDCAGRITTNGVTNSAYGGPDGKTLIGVGGGTAAKLIQVSVPGLP